MMSLPLNVGQCKLPPGQPEAVDDVLPDDVTTSASSAVAITGKNTDGRRFEAITTPFV
jgi:hypothetical protein